MPLRLKLALPSLIVCAGALGAAYGAAPAATPPPATAKLVTCELRPGLATFRGSMQAVDATDQMWLRFALYQRTTGGSFERVDAPALKVWRKSGKGVSKFGYNQTVKGLKAGHSYRASISFRWYDASGKRIRSDRRDSPACNLSNGANLHVAGISPRPGPSPGTSSYATTVENNGNADVERVVVQLVVDGAELDAREIPVVRKGESRTVEFSGPVCRTLVRAVVDPRNTIGELDETDNTRKAPCAAG